MPAAAPHAKRTPLRGPAGALEVLIENTVGRADAFGVICHPHPLYGGTLDNKVVYTLARAFQELGAPTLRFNFRGVGASEGEFGNGVGETDDALVVVAEGRRRWPGAELWLAGFSFGGAVAIRACARARAARLVSVAPAISRIDLAGTQMPDCPWLIVLGDADELVDAREVRAWAAQREPPPQLIVLPGVEHFFHGKLLELRDAVTGFMGKQKPG